VILLSEVVIDCGAASLRGTDLICTSGEKVCPQWVWHPSRGNVRAAFPVVSRADGDESLFATPGSRRPVSSSRIAGADSTGPNGSVVKQRLRTRCQRIRAHRPSGQHPRTSSAPPTPFRPRRVDEVPRHGGSRNAHPSSPGVPRQRAPFEGRCVRPGRLLVPARRAGCISPRRRTHGARHPR
jgi:hypothetical protein